MSEAIFKYRLRAAAAARSYLSGSMSWDVFIQEFGGTEDKLVGIVLDMIEHEPQCGGILGVNEETWVSLRTQLDKAIRDLET